MREEVAFPVILFLGSQGCRWAGEANAASQGEAGECGEPGLTLR